MRQRWKPKESACEERVHDEGVIAISDEAQRVAAPSRSILRAVLARTSKFEQHARALMAAETEHLLQLISPSPPNPPRYTGNRSTNVLPSPGLVRNEIRAPIASASFADR